MPTALIDYDSPKGLGLTDTTQKQDASVKGATYDYDPETGRLLTRTWARTVAGAALTATYIYDDAGRLWKIDYSDATPDVTYTYHADGQLKTTQDAAGLHTYTYGGPNRSLSGEAISGTGLLSGASWSSSFDNKDRRAGFTWTWGSHSRATGYGYDGADRLQSITAFGQSATYAYEATTGRLDTLTYTGAGLKGDWDHDAHGRLDQVSWKVGLDTRSLHDYGYDSMNRRTTALRENGEAWHYDYNGRGEVTSAVKRTGIATTSPAKTGLRSGYGYDLIGNRITDAEHTPESGNGLTEVDWTPNALNQITERGLASSRWVLGHAKEAAQLSAEGASGSIERAGSEFAVPIARSSSGAPTTGADWHELKITATAPAAGRVVNGVAQDVTAKETARLWFAASPEAMTYDADGNLTQDGRWSYEWDAENRLRAMETTSAAATAGVPKERLEFAYDAQGRRVQKVVKLYSLTAGAFVTLHDTRFLYDSWNLMAQFEVELGISNLKLTASYAWGRDLSGSMSGAGGVGGLLFVQQSSTTVNNSQQPQASLQAPCYDGNGNITAYVDVASGTVISKHDYDAFGRPVWTELGSGTARVPFGFSTKYEDAETGMLYYGFRYYSPEMGRWLNRDPIGERGGINLYGMLGNNPLNWVDVLGLASDNCYYVWINVLVKKSGRPATPAHAGVGSRPSGSMDTVEMWGTDQQGNWDLDQTYDPKTKEIGKVKGRVQGKVYECCCLSDSESAELKSRLDNLRKNQIPEGSDKGKPLVRDGNGVASSPNGVPYNCGTAVSTAIHGLGGCPTDNIWNKKPGDLAPDDDGMPFFDPVKELDKQMGDSVKAGKCKVVHNEVPAGNKYR